MVGTRNSNGLIVFAKAPIPGKVKTRLQPHITPENSADFQEALVKDAIAKIKNLNMIDGYIFFMPEEKKYFFENLVRATSIALKSQRGENRVERFINSIQDLFDQGYSRVVLTLTDCPTLGKEYIEHAFSKLNESDAVIGPSIDGGFCLIGFTKDVFSYFTKADWGSMRYLDHMEEIITKQNLKLSVLNMQYDIDSIELLRYLKIHLRLLCLSKGDYPVNTKRFLDDINI